MPKNPPSPLQTAFWLTPQERRFILAVSALVLLGLAARFFYLKHREPGGYTPAVTEAAEMQ
jgi:hypothetical protein